MVAVDRKSNDGTHEIAKRYADVFFEFDFKDDFSDVRNQMIEKSSMGWILVMDGHETFVNPEKAVEVLEKAYPQKYIDYLDAEGKKLTAHFSDLSLIDKLGYDVLEIKKVRIDGLSVQLELQDEEGAVLGQQLRFFRNIKGIRYEGAVHNRLSVSSFATLSAPHLTIKHERSDKKRADRKDQRDRMILEVMGKRLKTNPEDCRAHYYLGCVFNEKKEHKKAEMHFKKYVKYSEFEEEIYLASWHLSRALFWQDKIPEAKQVLFDMMQQRWDLPLAYNSLGEIALKKEKKYAEAEHWFKAARDKKYPNVSCFFPKYQFTWFPWMQLVEVYSQDAYNTNMPKELMPKSLFDAITCGCRCFEYADFPDNQKQRLSAHIFEWKKDYEKHTGENLDIKWAGAGEHSNANADVNSSPVARLPSGRIVKPDMAGVESPTSE